MVMEYWSGEYSMFVTLNGLFVYICGEIAGVIGVTPPSYIKKEMGAHHSDEPGTLRSTGGVGSTGRASVAAVAAFSARRCSLVASGDKSPRESISLWLASSWTKARNSAGFPWNFERRELGSSENIRCPVATVSMASVKVRELA